MHINSTTPKSPLFLSMNHTSACLTVVIEGSTELE